ncbi:MAG: VOC family protein [Chitinophagaceae bacterium]|nr:VOC family protein [Chitinophagaceae bacterium]
MKKTFNCCIALLLMLFAATNLAAQAQKPVLNHIAIYVKDLQKSTDFYHDVVQIDTIPEPFHDGKHTWFEIGPNSHLHVIKGASEVTTHDKNSHLCFSVPSMEDVIKRLVKNNIVYYSWAGEKNSVTLRVDGIKQIYFTDPDGYWVEINSDYPKK